MNSPIPELPVNINLHVCTNPLYWFATLSVTILDVSGEIAMSAWNTGTTVGGVAVIPLSSAACVVSDPSLTTDVCTVLANGCFLLQKSDNGVSFAIDASAGCENEAVVSGLIQAAATLTPGSAACPWAVWQVVLLVIGIVALFIALLAWCCFACCRGCFDQCCCCCSWCCRQTTKAPAEVGEVVNPLAAPTPEPTSGMAELVPVQRTAAPSPAVATWEPVAQAKPPAEVVATPVAAAAAPAAVRLVNGADGTQYLIGPDGTATPVKADMQ